MIEVLEQLWQHAADFSQALQEVSVTNLTNVVSKKLKDVKSKSMQGANKRPKENYEPVSAKIESGSAIFLEELATTGPGWELTIRDFLEFMMLLITGSLKPKLKNL
ncbi:hypothetical protein FRC09_013868 [Ceratobasidium sp. 395]|nr:hypothetical protein FRC09_013868 [Ceratobasidium sp. 395]